MGSGRTVMGLAMVLVSLIGLIMASQAVDTGIYLSGLAIFAFGVLFVYRMVQKYAAGPK